MSEYFKGYIIIDEVDGKIDASIPDGVKEEIYSKSCKEIIDFLVAFDAGHEIKPTHNIAGSGVQARAADFLAYKTLVSYCVSVISDKLKKGTVEKKELNKFEYISKD